MLTLGDCKNDYGLQRVAGYSPSSPEFTDYVNTACRRLLRRGDFPGTTEGIYVAIYQGCVTWPRYVKNIRRMSVCHHRDVPTKNKWWEWVGDRSSCAAGGATDRHLIHMGNSSVFQNVLGDGRYVVAYARHAQDYGKTLTIYGTDNNGQRIQTNLITGWQDGVTLTFAQGPVSTPAFVRRIDYIVKDLTTGPIDVYALNTATGLLEDVAHYEGSETRPSYMTSKFSLGLCSCSSCTSGIVPAGVEALIKLRFIPAINDNDLVIIDNIDALKSEIQALRLGEAGDIQGKTSAGMDAVAELNRDLEDSSPDAQFSVSVNILGKRGRTNQAF